GDDFYQYANGGWLAKNPIPPEFSIWGGFVQLAERNRAILREILEKAAQSDSLEKAEPGGIQQKLGDFYASGMDEAAVNREGIAPISANLFCKISALAIRVSGVVRLALPPFGSSFQLGVSRRSLARWLGQSD